MDLKNIKKIMKSDLWEEIISDENYLDYKIVDTSKKGYYHMVAVFFDMYVSKETMKEANSLVKLSGAKISSVNLN